MRDKFRQLCTDNPRLLNATYALVLAGTYAADVGTNAAAGGVSGP